MIYNREASTNLCWPEKTDGLKMLHCFSSLGINAFKQIDFFLQNFTLGINHTDNPSLKEKSKSLKEGLRFSIAI